MNESALDDQNQKQDSPPSARRRLGRGLNALLGGGRKVAESTGEVEGTTGTTGDSQIAHELIDRNPFQPRQAFDAESLAELAESIRQHGVLQPLLVRPANGRFQLIAGERRWRAAQQAGLADVPCRVMELEDRAVCEIAIEENLKRKDLSVLEKAEAFRDYLERFDSTVEELSKRLSMSRSALSNTIRLLELPKLVKKALREDRISSGHARALLPLGDDDCVALCKRIERESLSVRITEQAAKEIQATRHNEQLSTEQLMQMLEENAPPEADPPAGEVVIYEPASLTPHLASLQDQLRQALGLQVEIRLKGEDAGEIVIPFATNAEFENLLRQLRRAA